MKNSKTFGVLGGDKRQLYTAAALKDDGNRVFICGFDNSEDAEMLSSVSPEELARCDNIILPLPVTRDGININAPYCPKKINLYSFLNTVRDKNIFLGMKDRLSPEYQTANIYDYAKREDFALDNAVPTAEGAIGTAVNEYDGTIFGSRVLVAGYGRIGKKLSRLLFLMGADVSVSARKRSDLTAIYQNRMTPVTYNELGSNYDIVFNTVPYMIFDKNTLESIKPCSLIIDLSSLPGGIDINACETLGIKAVRALSLPGKTAPKTSGIIIKNTIYNIIGEEGL